MTTRSTNPSGNERRTAHRVQVDILLNKYLDGRPYLCRATNLSRGGMLVHRIIEPKTSQTRVGLQFQLPDSERIIACFGQIVHDHGSTEATGIAITSISAEHQELLDAYVKRSCQGRVP